MTPDAPTVRGTAQNPDTFFQAREACNKFYDAVPAIVQQEMDRLRGIIDSMTPQERRDPVSVIGKSRARRIAAGAGVGCEEVGHLVRQFRAMADILDHLARRGPPGRDAPG